MSTEFAVIFDVDGVLLDSMDISDRATKKILAEYGVDFDKLIDPTGEKHQGASVGSILKLINDQFGISIDQEEFLSKRIPEVISELGKSNIVIDDNLLALLKELKAHNIPISSASSGGRIITEAKLEMLGVEKFFEVLITASDVDNHKPHPEPYLTVAKKLNIRPSNCIVIEDSLVGMQAARAAGMKFVAFTKHHREIKDLSSVMPSLIVNDWEELNYEVLKKVLSE